MSVSVVSHKTCTCTFSPHVVLEGDHFYCRSLIKVMRKRPAEEEVRTEALSAARGEIVTYRKVLLEFCDRVGCDIVDLDQERAICTVAIVSSRRITRALINSVIQNAMEALAKMDAKVDGMLAFGVCKGHLQAEVDKVSFVASVLPSDSAEARRKRRGENEVVRGGPDLVDETTREICELFWSQVQARDELEAEAKADKKRAKVTPPSPANTAMEAPVAKLPVQKTATVAPAPPPKTAKAASKRPAKRPRSSISKKVAHDLLALVADYIANHWGDGQGVTPAIHKLVDEFWASA